MNQKGRSTVRRGGSIDFPPVASHALVAPQARSIIAVEERPHDSMPLPDADADRVWAHAH